VIQLSGQDLTPPFGYDLMCRSRHADHCRLSPPEATIRRF
jgi:hypothetical protein